MDSLFSQILAVLGSVGAGVFAMWVFERLVGKKIAAMHPRSKRRMLFATLVWCFLLTPAAGYGIWRLLIVRSKARAAAPADADFVLLAGSVELAVLAGFLGFFLSGILLSLLVEPAEWLAAPVLAPLLSVVVLGPLLLLAAALTDWHTVVSPAGIRFDPLLSWTARSFTYDQIRSIRTAPSWIDSNGAEEFVREYVICFHDGSVWGTMWTSAAFRPPDKSRLADLAVTRSGVKLTELKQLTAGAIACAPLPVRR
ncbi:MAG: hypothetical protein ACKV22_22850 [Bryobacteraceae bacterium]